MGHTSGNDTNVEIFFGWMNMWSDIFLSSYVKKKKSNVWMHTITLPDPDVNLTPSFHTYAVAVGIGHPDHTEGVEWYANKINELMTGKTYYYGIHQKFIIAKSGAVATPVDQQKRVFSLKISLLGVYLVRLPLGKPTLEQMI